MIEISIVIPVYNESGGISTLLDTLNDYYNKRDFDFEVIFVNDGSSDNTIDILKERKATILFPSKLISFSKNYGSHAAIRAGFINSKGRYSTYFPADIQISLESINKLYRIADSGYDVVFGIREVNKFRSLYEKIFSKAYAWVMQKYVDKQFPFEGIETVVVSGKVRAIFNSNIEANSSFPLQLLSMGFKNKFVGIEKIQRTVGKSKWTLSKKVKLLLDSFVAFSYAPIRLVSITGMILFVLGISWTIYISLRKIFYDDLVTGWAALTSILLLGFGITNISLGIIAEYLWRTLDISRKRPVFIIDEITDLNSNEK